MTQEEKELLLQDLCGRLPYGFIVGSSFTSINVHITINTLNWFKNYIDSLGNTRFKPYLRSLSSMTEKERDECRKLNDFYYYDYLNANHFDYRGLIAMGLALEAPQDMYW